MTNHSGPSAERWDTLIDEFRSFGGTANNVIQRQGPLGLGLFPIDSSQPIELHAPEHLLIPTDNLELKHGEVRIKNKQPFPEGYAAWYHQFQKEYSWGAEASRSIIAFESELQKLPDSIQRILNRFLPIPIKQRFPGSNIEQEAFNRFILTRQINWGSKNVMMPIIELVNHSPAQNTWVITDEGISVNGQFQDEILVRYSVSDPMHRFIQYGFSCEELMGFSMSMKLNHRGQQIIVRGGINFTPFKPLPVSTKGEQIIINKPLIGCENRPRMPKTVFSNCCEHLKGVNSEELFGQICQANQLAVVQILRELKKDNLASSIKEQLQETCWLQLNAIGEHYGHRGSMD